MGTRGARICIISLILALALVQAAATAAVAAPAFVSGQVTRDGYWQMNPEVSGRRMVWYDDRTGNGDIYLLDRDVSATPTRLTMTDDQENEPAIDGVHIVYTRLTGGHYGIWMYTIGGTGLNPTPVNLNDGNDHRHPRVDGNWVVWETTLATGGSQIQYWDIAGIHRHTAPILASLYPRDPDVSAGTMVCAITQGGNDSLLRWADGDAHAEFFATMPSHKSQPRISGSRVVWADDRNSATTGHDIYTTTIGGISDEAFSAQSGDESAPEIDGDVVVWSREDAAGNGHVWRQQVSRSATQLSSGAGAEGRPAISGNAVAWQSFGYDSAHHYVSGDVFLAFMPYYKGYSRSAGTDRFSTAVAASSPWSGGGRVILTTGRNWPDALGGAALAGVYDCPILLTERLTLPVATRNRLQSLNPSAVTILGSGSAVDTAVATAVRAAVPGVTVDRVGGADRYVTANMIAARVKTTTGSTYDGHVFVATGLGYPDALSAAPLMFAHDAPLFLVGKNGLTDATKAGMAAAHIIILGSADSVSDEVEDDIRASFPAAQVQRVEGVDRYATSVAVADFGVSHFALDRHITALVKGTDFPDALAAGPNQGHSNGVQLLTKPDVLPDVTAATLWSHRSSLATLRIYGGVPSVSDYVKGRAALALE